MTTATAIKAAKPLRLSTVIEAETAYLVECGRGEHSYPATNVHYAGLEAAMKGMRTADVSEIGRQLGVIRGQATISRSKLATALEVKAVRLVKAWSQARA